MTHRPGKPSLRLWIGLAVLAVGVIQLLEAARLVDAGRVLRWWPALLLAGGLYLLTRGLPRGHWFPGALLTLVGGALLATRFGWLEVGLDKLWPLVVVLLGLAIMSRGMRRGASEQSGSEADVSRLAILSGLKPKITSTDFRGGEVSAVLGSCELDLTEAEMTESGATLELFALMGAIEVRVPAGWSVDSRVVPVMASVEDSRRKSEDVSTGHLQLRGFVMMGGVEVKN